MAQYSGSACWIGGAALGIALLGGCATPAPQPAAVRPPAPTPVPVSRPTETAPLPPSAMPAAPVAVREDAPLRYVVQPGDTLWGLAQRFLVKPWQWPEIWFVNEQVANPHLIYPGDVLTLIVQNGRPQLVRDTSVPDRVLRLGPQVRELDLDQAIPAIPLEAIRDFLSAPRLIGAEELERAPYIVAFGEDQLIAGANSPAYVRGVPPEADYRWAVVRPDEAIHDPDTRKVLGFAATPVGGLEIREYGEPAAYAWLTVSQQESRVGDRLVPIEDASFDARFYPRAPTEAVDGRVVWIADQRLQATQYQVVAFNRGLDHGLVPGHLLTLREAGRVVTDPYTKGDVELPDREIGTLMVFKVGPQLGFGLVLDATRPINRLDRVVHPSGS